VDVSGLVSGAVLRDRAGGDASAAGRLAAVRRGGRGGAAGHASEPAAADGAADAVNYSIGYRLGPKVFKWEHGRFFNRHHLEKTQAFYDRYGGITIILARFVPFARTFAPFVAGIGQMQYRKFAIYNVVGAVAWVGLFLTAGALFGSHPIVQRNFKLVLVAIVVISLLPLLIGWLRNRSAAKVETAVVAPPPAPLEEGGERACA
jgi:hypothetical protein